MSNSGRPKKTSSQKFTICREEPEAVCLSRRLRHCHIIPLSVKTAGLSMIHVHGLGCGGNWRAGEVESRSCAERCWQTFRVFPGMECVKAGITETRSHMNICDLISDHHVVSVWIHLCREMVNALLCASRTGQHSGYKEARNAFHLKNAEESERCWLGHFSSTQVSRWDDWKLNTGQRAVASWPLRATEVVCPAC